MIEQCNIGIVPPLNMFMASLNAENTKNEIGVNGDFYI